MMQIMQMHLLQCLKKKEKKKQKKKEKQKVKQKEKKKVKVKQKQMVPEYGDGTSTFVFGGGAGAEYFLTENVKLYLDAVYQYGKKDGVKMVNNPVLSLGIAYAF